MDHRTRALIWLEIAERSTAFKEQAAKLAKDWLMLAHLEELRGRDEADGTNTGPGTCVQRRAHEQLSRMPSQCRRMYADGAHSG
jgi:hypothetical protein